MHTSQGNKIDTLYNWGKSYRVEADFTITGLAEEPKGKPANIFHFTSLSLSVARNGALIICGPYGNAALTNRSESK